MEGESPAEVTTLPVLGAMSVFLLWCLNIQNANNQGAEVALGLALLVSFVVCLGYTIAYLIRKPPGFVGAFLLGWMASLPVAVVLLLRSNPLTWGGIMWGEFATSLATSLLPCVAAFVLSRGNKGALYAVPAVVVCYHFAMIATWGL